MTAKFNLEKTEKRCSACRVTKPLTEFSKHNVTKDGLRTQCRLCCEKADKKYREKPDIRGFANELCQQFLGVKSSINTWGHY